MSKPKAQKKLNLKDRVDEDSLDLSMSDLEKIPVMDIAELTRVKKINLSYNQINSLPENFIELKGIRELDLSKNHLKTLSKNFGQMVNLRRLDLLGNQITHLPASFAEIKTLQWLDLKDNPLEPGLKQAAGDCLDEADCKKCAINVLKYMKVVAAEEERQRQINQKKNKEIEKLKKDAEEKEKERHRELKKQEKEKEKEEKRRLFNEQKKKLDEAKSSESDEQDDDGDDNNSSRLIRSNLKKQNSLFLKMLKFLFYTTLFAVVFFLLTSTYCTSHIQHHLDISKTKPKKGAEYSSIVTSVFKQPMVASSLQFFDKEVCVHVRNSKYNMNNIVKSFKELVAKYV